MRERAGRLCEGSERLFPKVDPRVVARLRSASDDDDMTGDGDDDRQEIGNPAADYYNNREDISPAEGYKEGGNGGPAEYYKREDQGPADHYRREDRSPADCHMWEECKQ